uniref:Uncharacterized protein n=1 Tax=Streptomyces sp. NBC_00093 TaxID=2975649 RepID=A0AAU1ZUT4_9ACTN
MTRASLAWAVDGPGKVPLDLAPAVTLAGNCPADIAVLRAERVRGNRWPPHP